MALGSATITAKFGAGTQATTAKLQNVSNMNFDMARQLVQFFGPGPNQLIAEYDLQSLGTSITVTVTGIGTAAAAYAVTMS